MPLLDESVAPVIWMISCVANKLAVVVIIVVVVSKPLPERVSLAASVNVPLASPVPAKVSSTVNTLPA